ncbi:hypothetical protein H7H37_15275, partial [Mycolicibacterium insubricum]|nr:hypothetical protein [Mycolicibacterium insubricum]
AAVVGSFVSVIYRRQADADAAKVRDLKFVYDLQLDREISARRGTGRRPRPTWARSPGPRHYPLAR